MGDFEERLEEALTNMEFDCLTPADIAVIRIACGKDRSPKVENALENIFQDFSVIFGGKNESK